MQRSIELDWTFSTDPRVRDTYCRKLSDIRRATGQFSISKMPVDSPARFLGYYFGCEKLAKGALGIARLWPAEKAFCHKTPLDLDQLNGALKKLGVPFPDDDLTKIFGTQPVRSKPTWGREIRNRLIHDFGPSNVDHAKAATKTLVPVMRKFLGYDRQIEGYVVSLSKQHAISSKKSS